MDPLVLWTQGENSCVAQHKVHVYIVEVTSGEIMLCNTSLNLCCGLLQGFLKIYRSPQSSMFSPFGVHLLNRLNHLHDEQSRGRDVRVI